MLLCQMSWSVRCGHTGLSILQLERQSALMAPLGSQIIQTIATKLTIMRAVRARVRALPSGAGGCHVLCPLRQLQLYQPLSHPACPTPLLFPFSKLGCHTCRARHVTFSTCIEMVARPGVPAPWHMRMSAGRLRAGAFQHAQGLRCATTCISSCMAAQHASRAEKLRTADTYWPRMWHAARVLAFLKQNEASKSCTPALHAHQQSHASSAMKLLPRGILKNPSSPQKVPA